MLTSATQHGDTQRCRQLGIAIHLIKPIRQQELYNAFIRVLAHKQPVKPVQIHPPVLIRNTGHSLRILLAEDNPVNQKLAVRVLEKLGHTVDVAENGRLAVEAVANDEFDVVLMDVQMPEMSGLEATRLIRQTEEQSGHHIPIVAMTAHALKGDKEKCLEAGMDGYLSKPISAGQLGEVLRCVAPIASSTSGTPLWIDFQTIYDRAGGDAELLKELAQTFISNASALMKQIHTALELSDYVTLERAAHSYRGAAAIFELTDLVETATALESAATQIDAAAAEALVLRLEAQNAQAVEFLAGFVQEVACGS
jgi:CheY-like chemotaxis protein